MQNAECRPIPRRRAFTLVELLVVIGIIAALIAILIPVVASVRIKGYEADSRNWIGQLAGAVERYQQDFRAYPGPLANNEIRNDGSTSGPGMNQAGSSFTNPFFSYPLSPPAGYDMSSQIATQARAKFTMSENLVLGLLGGLHVDTTRNVLEYDPSIVGNGPFSLTLAGAKRYEPYLEAKNLSWQGNPKTGRYSDGAGFADDSIIPEFIDRFPESMPILYMRAKNGANGNNVTVAAQTPQQNPVITFSTAPGWVAGPGQYDLDQIIAYTGSFSGPATAMVLDTNNPPTAGTTSIGSGKKAPANYYAGSTTPIGPSPATPYHGLRTVDVLGTTDKSAAVPAKYYYPYEAFGYFNSPSVPNTARQKDGYILISAGADRIFGTSDDICSFGAAPGQ